MSKHTPGPWMADGWDETEEGCAVLAVHEEFGLRSPTRGMVAWVTTVAGASFESPDKAYANARLIASAPDLLAMLERIRDDKTFRTNDNALWPDLLAVIAKSQGAA